MNRIIACSTAFVLLLLAAGATQAGSLYLTGHDTLLHGGQRGYDGVILDYLREKGTLNEVPKSAYTISVVGSGVGFANFTGGANFAGALATSGSTIPAVGTLAGYGTATYYKTGTSANWATILSADALVILSHQSCGGCDLDNAGSAEINSHAAAIGAAFDAGMDIWANAGANLATYYGFLPAGALATGAPLGGSTGFFATAAGSAIGIVDPTPGVNTATSMINGFPTHNQFPTFSSRFTLMETHSNATPPVAPGLENVSIALQGGRIADFTSFPLSDLIDGGSIVSGDKTFSDFTYHGGGDMPAAEDIFVKAITDADGNFGIRFQGAFVDAVGGGASDALIDYTVTAPDGKLIKDVNLAANPLVVGGANSTGLVSITETFLPDNDQTVLSVFDIRPGLRKLTDRADLVDENGDLAPVKELHVQKDILVWSQSLGSAATLSFIDQTFSQCDEDPMNPGACLMMMHPGDFNGDGVVDTADYVVWRKGLGSIYTPDDYEVWRANFGSTWSIGASSLPDAAVPEPASMLLVLAAAGWFSGDARSRTKSHQLFRA
jgi:hypothetical protein